jgi:tetratricopeptide (TPR) repeat protein
MPLVAFALLSLAVYLAFVTFFKVSNNDIWIHLETGEYVLTHLRVPVTDPYSFTAAGRSYVAHEWLAGVLFYLVYSGAGVGGLILFKAAVIAGTVVLLFLAARRLRGRLSVILPVFALVLYLGSARFFERPHIFSYLLAAVILWLFLRYREGGRDRRWLYAIIPVQVLWVNLHGGWVEGVALVAVFAAGELLTWLRARYLLRQPERSLPARDVGLLAALVPAGLAASLVNPYGWRILLFPFQLTGLQLFMQEVYEWRPPWDPSFNTSTAFVLYLLFAGALFLSFFAAGREPGLPPRQARARKVFRWVVAAALAAVYLALVVCWFGRSAGWWTPEVLRMALLALLGLFVLFVLDNFRTVDYTLAGIVLLFYVLSLRHCRAVVDFALVAGVVLVAAASRWLEERRLRRPSADRAGRKKAKTSGKREAAPEAGGALVDRSSPAAVVGGSVLLLALALHGTLDRYYLDFDGTPREAGFGVAANIPVAAADFLARNGIAGNAFASYSHAALLIHRLGPAVKVNMDSRNDVYGEALYAEYRAALGAPPAMEAYLRKYPVDFFCLTPGDCAPGNWSLWTAAGGGWAPVFIDDQAIVLLKREPRFRKVIAREELRWLRPTSLPPLSVTADFAPAVLAEAERCIRNSPGSWYGYFYKVKALVALARFEDTLAACEQLARVNPAEPTTYFVMAGAALRLNRPLRAVEAYRKVLELDPGNAQARDGLRRLGRE